MKKQIILIILANFALQAANSQDTFSIVSVDSVTGEVGSAGASFVVLFRTSQTTDHFLG